MNAKVQMVSASLAVLAAAASCTAQSGQAPPVWAYPINPPAPPSVSTPPIAPPSPANNAKLTVRGSQVAFTAAELRNLFSVPDWRPEEHSPMPAIVAQGRKPNVQACGYCHLPAGEGRPENASLAGLSYDYIVAQMADMKSGKRRTSVSSRLPGALMLSIAKAASEADVAEAATYFSALKAISHTKVVEADRAPKTHVQAWVVARAETGGSEALGQRIVETPDAFEAFERRDGHTAYTAYVPPGAIAAGQSLTAVRRGEDKQTCADCHGADYRGKGNAPRLAGRSPSYLARQLYDFQTGARDGTNAGLMKPMVAGIGEREIVRLTAFLASRAP